MLLAVFSDPHANLPALMAVLGRVDEIGPDMTLCAGDLVGYGPHPNEVVELVQSRRIPTVRGDHDDAVGHDREAWGPLDAPFSQRLLYHQSVAWTLRHTSDDNKLFLRRLPLTLSANVRGRSLVLAHGSPRRIDQPLGPGTAVATLRRLLGEAHAHIMVAGHSHEPVHRVIDGRHLINPGPVGRPAGGRPEASMALIEVGNSVEVRFIRVPYDSASVAADIRSTGLPSQLARDLLPGQD